MLSPTMQHTHVGVITIFLKLASLCIFSSFAKLTTCLCICISVSGMLQRSRFVITIYNKFIIVTTKLITCYINLLNSIMEISISTISAMALCIIKLSKISMFNINYLVQKQY